MKTNHLASSLAVLVVSGALCHAVDRYVSLDGGHVPPFTNWVEAATNIQDAIDAASAGDVIWVTNGIYATGGKVMAGDLTNRVTLDKALTVQSVNGPLVTSIQGVGPAGNSAVRCAWLTDGATLSGFTMRGGTTRTSDDTISLQSGGGVWCLSTNATVTNCTILQNSSAQYGGGAYSGSLNNCLIRDNSAARGGGAAYSTLSSCYLTVNSAAFDGGGVYAASAKNCAMVRNSAVNGSGGGSYLTSSAQVLVNCTLAENSTTVAATAGAGASGSQFTMQNCIVWNNWDSIGRVRNYSGGSLAYCCSLPLPSGTGNISAAPQLLGDGAHLAETSPCRGAGSSLYATGKDIDGQNWAGTPSMGCDEWYPEPLIILQPKPKTATGTGRVRMHTAVAGQEPFYFFWSKDGLPVEDNSHYAAAHTASALINEFGLSDAGAYQVVVTNAVGMATSEIAQVNIHCVDASGAAPSPPYTNWGAAAATIQDAIEVAVLSDVVLVTNGVYASGGKVIHSVTNRVVVDKAILVTSVNGPDATVIQGQWDPTTTNGPSAVRCAWLADGAGLGGFGAGLSGFTLRDGATWYTDRGGGAYCAFTNADLANCVITNCRSGESAGGVWNGTLNHCTLVGNSTGTGGGGGAAFSLLLNCLITRNYAPSYGGGVRYGTLYNCVVTENCSGRNGGGGYDVASAINCTVTRNSAAYIGGGLRSSSTTAVTNCIVYFNSAISSTNLSTADVGYTCSMPVRPGPGNISDDPQLVDSFHLAVTSPCRGTGSSLVSVGADIDGEAWASPPSMGCDEVWESGLTGPLSVSLTAAYPEVAAYGAMPLTGEITGRAARLEWSFGDGPVYTNLSYFTLHTWTNPGDYTVTFTAFNTDNPGGVSTNLLVHVVPLESPLLSVAGDTETNFSLSFPGQPGVTYVVEQTTNLVPVVTWQTVQTLTSTGEMMQVTHTKGTNEMRFYRARTL